MSTEKKYRRILEKWQNSKQPARPETVDKLLNHYGFTQISHKPGSHTVYSHPILKEMVNLYPTCGKNKTFDHNGNITVSMHDNEVKLVYLRMICDAIEYIEDHKKNRKLYGIG